MNDLLNAEQIQTACRGLRLGHRVVLLEETVSTNDDVKALFPTSEPEGVVVIAQHQTQGRGRTGPWRDVAGGMLLMSVLLRPQRSLKDSSGLTLMVAEAVCEAVRQLCAHQSVELRVQLKHPNDVLANGYKICGILCESHSQGNTLQAVAVGIGLNVNVAQEFFVQQGLMQASSLSTLTGQAWSRQDVVVAVLRQLDHLYFK